MMYLSFRFILKTFQSNVKTLILNVKYPYMTMGQRIVMNQFNSHRSLKLLHTSELDSKINVSKEQNTVYEMHYEVLDYEQFSYLATNKDIENQIKLIIMEYEIAKEHGERLPSTVLPNDMEMLLQLNSVHRRLKYFRYLFNKEVSKLSDIKKKEKMKMEREKLRQEGKIGVPKNTFFIYIRNSSMGRFYNGKQAYAAMYGSSFVIDMGYDEYMSKQERINCAQQIQYVYASNKTNRDPFNLHFCNAVRSNPCVCYLEDALPHLYETHCLATVTEESYLDIFDKRQLVYITPDAENVLDKLDHDCVYIIAAFVDRSNSRPLALAKAKREGVKTARLPFERYIYWVQGSKYLPLNQQINILLDYKTNNDWQKAFRFVPSRKVRKVGSLGAGNGMIQRKIWKRALNASSLFSQE